MRCNKFDTLGYVVAMRANDVGTENEAGSGRSGFRFGSKAVIQPSSVQGWLCAKSGNPTNCRQHTLPKSEPRTACCEFRRSHRLTWSTCLSRRFRQIAGATFRRREPSFAITSKMTHWLAIHRGALGQSIAHNRPCPAIGRRF